MPYPAGMVTRDVVFPANFGVGGTPLKTSVRVTPSRAFIWEATGEAFLVEPVRGEGTGTPVTIELPVPGQPGFIDGDGNTISDWNYTASYILATGVEIPMTTFNLPAAELPLQIIPNVSEMVYGGVVNTPVPVVGPQGPPGPAGAAAPDATTLVKGLVRLAGDLGGTADAPIVPGLAIKADVGHAHTIADVTGLQAALDGKQPAGSYAAAAHTHAIADVTGLQAALDGKQPAGSYVTGFADPNADRIVFWDDSASAYAALQVSTGLSLSGTTLTVSAASETVSGRVELATAAETATGTDTTRAVHPAGLKSVTDALAAAKADVSHVHAAGDVTSGVFPIARLATGTPDGTKFIRDDGTLAVPPGGGGGGAMLNVLTKAGGTLTNSWRAVAGSSSAPVSGEQPPAAMYVAGAMTIDGLGFRLTTVESGALMRILLYDSDADGHPVNLVASVNGIDCTSGVGMKFGTLGAPVALDAGLYWGFLRADSPGGTVRYQALTPQNDLMVPDTTGFSPAAIARTLRADPGTYASATDPITSWAYADPTSTATPMILLRRAT